MNTTLYTREQIHQLVDQLLLLCIIPNTGPGPAVSEQPVIKPAVSRQPANQPPVDVQKKEEHSPSVSKLGLTVDEAAKMLGVSKPTLTGLLHNNEIPYKRVGRRFIIPRKEFMEWLSAL